MSVKIGKNSCDFYRLYSKLHTHICTRDTVYRMRAIAHTLAHTHNLTHRYWRSFFGSVALASTPTLAFSFFPAPTHSAAFAGRQTCVPTCTRYVKIRVCVGVCVWSPRREFWGDNIAFFAVKSNATKSRLFLNTHMYIPPFTHQIFSENWGNL